MVELKEQAQTDSTAEDRQKCEDYRRQFHQAINDDLNTARALAVAWEILHATSIAPRARLQILEDFDQVLGLDIQGMKAPELALTPEIEALISERQQARQEKNWQRADAIRQQLQDMGYELLDSKAGVKVKKLRS